MTEEKTVQQHMQAVEAVSKLLTDTTAQIERLRKALAASRATLEALADYQHPKVKMPAPYHMRASVSNDRDVTPATVIAAQVEAINATLGDRA